MKGTLVPEEEFEADYEKIGDTLSKMKAALDTDMAAKLAKAEEFKDTELDDNDEEGTAQGMMESLKSLRPVIKRMEKLNLDKEKLTTAQACADAIEGHFRVQWQKQMDEAEKRLKDPENL